MRKFKRGEIIIFNDSQYLIISNYNSDMKGFQVMKITYKNLPKAIPINIRTEHIRSKGYVIPYISDIKMPNFPRMYYVASVDDKVVNDILYRYYMSNISASGKDKDRTEKIINNPINLISKVDNKLARVI